MRGFPLLGSRKSRCCHGSILHTFQRDDEERDREKRAAFTAPGAVFCARGILKIERSSTLVTLVHDATFTSRPRVRNSARVWASATPLKSEAKVFLRFIIRDWKKSAGSHEILMSYRWRASHAPLCIIDSLFGFAYNEKKTCEFVAWAVDHRLTFQTNCLKSLFDYIFA